MNIGQNSLNNKFDYFGLDATDIFPRTSSVPI